MSDIFWENIVHEEQMSPYEKTILSQKLWELSRIMKACNISTECLAQWLLARGEAVSRIKAQNELNLLRYGMREAWRWDMPPEELLAKFQESMHNMPPWFRVKEINQWVSPFIVFLIPQKHASPIDHTYSPESIVSQKNIARLILWLEANKLSNINLWEWVAEWVKPEYILDENPVSIVSDSDARGLLRKEWSSWRFLNFYAESDLSNYKIEHMASILKKFKAAQVVFSFIEGIISDKNYPSLEKLDSVRKEISQIEGLPQNFITVNFPWLLKDSLSTDDISEFQEKIANIFQESDSISSILDNISGPEASARNHVIVSNTLLHYENTHANAFNLILGSEHFNVESNAGDPIQNLYKDQGISYILLESEEAK